MADRTISEGIRAWYKPLGMSSYDVIRRIKRQLALQGMTKPKIGHGGTLDPQAEGVLVIAIGRDYTRQLAQTLKGTTKTYEAIIYLGARSDTDDREGPITPTDPATVQIYAQNHTTALPDLSPFIHGYMQTPPRHSALKIQGKTAYARTRAGEELDMSSKARHVDIYSLAITDYSFPYLSITVTCGSGTYIRSLARDIGEHLGIGAYLYALKRTAVGEFTADEAVRIEELEN